MKDIKNVKNLVLSKCTKLTSLEGLPNTVTNIFIQDAVNLPLVEEDFAMHITLHGFKDYHLDLLKFIVNAKREREIKDVNWPDDFKKQLPELVKSTGGLGKFNI